MMTQENIPYTADEIKAMVKTCEKYNKALEKVKGLLKDQEMALHAREKLANVFPELIEKEDEKIRKEIIDFLELPHPQFVGKRDFKKWIAWIEKQGKSNVFDAPKISIKDAIEITSRIQYIEDDMKPIAEFIINYANWNLHKDEWNQPTLAVPLFRVLDALIQRGKPYGECAQNIEKLGEQKPTNNVEPKFHKYKWITNGEYIWKIVGVKPLDYILQSQDGNIVDDTISYVDEQFHLWAIADAKDGDVLVTEDYIFIFKYILHGGVHPYCHYNFDDEEFDSDISDTVIGNIHDKGIHFRPATKEERDTLVKAMANAGYRWNKEKLRLEKL